MSNIKMSRRNFLKVSGGLMVTSVAVGVGGMPAFADSTQINQENILTEFFSSFQENDHLSWTNCFSPSIRGYYHDFALSQSNQNARLGLLDVDSAQILYMEAVDSIYAPRYVEFSSAFSANNYACYKVISDMETSDSGYFGTGINYNLVLLVFENGQWNIGGICGCPQELCTAPSGIVLPRQSYGMVSCTSQPSTINVKDQNGTLHSNVAFSTFIKNATCNEIGTMGYATAAVNANVMAVKMCGWWAKAAGYRASEGCDIKYGDVAYKSSYTSNSAINTAVSSLSSTHVLSSGGKLFYTAYYAGSANDAGSGSGELRQNGSNYLAGQGKTWQQIIHYYYDNSSYNNPSVGIVSIGTN